MTRVATEARSGETAEWISKHVRPERRHRPRSPPSPAQTGEEDPRRPLLPAPIWSCGDRGPPSAVWDDGHERVLVVRQRRAPVTAPSFHQVQGVGKAILLWDGKTTEAVLEFLRTTRVGSIGTERVPPEEEVEDSKGVEGGLAFP